MSLIPWLLVLQAAGGGAAPGPEQGAAGGAAGAGAGGAGAAPPGFLDSPMLLFLVLGVLLYVMMLRPQAKERKARAAMLAALKKGDRVVMSCGLVGTVGALTENDVFLKFDDKDTRRMRFRRYAIQSVEKGDDSPEPAPEPETK